MQHGVFPRQLCDHLLQLPEAPSSRRRAWRGISVMTETLFSPFLSSPWYPLLYSTTKSSHHGLTCCTGEETHPQHRGAVIWGEVVTCFGEVVVESESLRKPQL